MKTESSLTVATSRNAIYAKFSGMTDTYVSDNYLAFLGRQRQIFAKNEWARIVDLSLLLLATPESNKAIIDSLVDDANAGLVLEIILPPKKSISQWQVEKTIASVQHTISFEFVSSVESANQILHNNGFSTDFSSEKTFVSKHTR
jgi:hypothetical protein